MGLNKNQPAKGTILIADPALDELYFHRSSILITEHGQAGTVGFVLNKEMGDEFALIANFPDDPSLN